MPAIDDARAEVVRLAQTGVDPVLTTDEINAILAKHLRASTWAAGTAYAYGAVVVPTARNGHRYRATYPGTSGATEPVWGTALYSQVSDGTALIWQEEGPDYGNPYDVRSSIREAWEMKAAKSSDRIQFSADGATFQEQQTPEFCLKMAERYAPVGVA